MKRRNSLYFKLNKARKVVANPLSADLSTLLSASMQLTRNNIVRRHIEQSIIELGYNYRSGNQYKLSA